MTLPWIQVAGALLGVLLLVYLMVALIKPEKFQ